MSSEQKVTPQRIARGLAFHTVLISMAMFWPAGTFAWPRGWAFVGLSVAFGVALTAWLYHYSPELLRERMGSLIQKDQPLADKVVILALVIAIAIWLPFISFDVFDLQIWPAPPALVSVLGFALWLGAAAIIFLTFRENVFAAPVVKHQAERKQRAIDTGPYAVVRHPMYAAMLMYFAGLPLWLGSTAGLVAAVVPAAVLVARIVVEESHLAHHLPGYEAYRRKVRWRLVPYLW